MKFKLMFEPRDLWIGCFWDRRWHDFSCGDDSGQKLHLYFCLVPTVVLRVVVGV